jgi:hypothetical protein
MKLTPRYDYYLNVDGTFYPIQYKVWVNKHDTFHMEVKDTLPILAARSENDLYKAFEEKANYALMRYHINGELWKMFPQYKGAFAAESARFVAYPYKPGWKKLLHKLWFKLRNWKGSHVRTDI